MASNSPAPDDPPALPDVAVCTALSNRRRRSLLATMIGVDGAISLDRLLDRTVDRERSRRDRPLPEGTLHRLRVALVHVDLPKLDDLGVLSYDRTARRVGAGRTFSRIEARLTETD